MKFEFDQGDIIVQLGDTQKWLVWEVSGVYYHLKNLDIYTGVDDVWSDLISEPVEKERCESTFIKVGKWSFKKGREVG